MLRNSPRCTEMGMLHQSPQTPHCIVRINCVVRAPAGVQPHITAEQINASKRSPQTGRCRSWLGPAATGAVRLGGASLRSPCWGYVDGKDVWEAACESSVAKVFYKGTLLSVGSNRKRVPHAVACVPSLNAPTMMMISQPVEAGNTTVQGAKIAAKAAKLNQPP